METEKEKELIRMEFAKNLIINARKNSSTNLSLTLFLLKKLPTEIYSLSNLLSLDLHSNSLSELTEEFNTFKMLEELTLARNKFETIPSQLFNLKNLKKLNLDLNRLVEVEPLTQLTQLEELDLGGNRIVEIPNFSRCTKLQRLGFTGNLIEYLDFDFLPDSLKSIALDYNPLKISNSDLEIARKKGIKLKF